MPKLLVLVYGDDTSTGALARAAADGAKRVRFTEVDLRRGDHSSSRVRDDYKPLESSEHIGDYDGVIVVCQSDGEVPSELTALLDALESNATETFANTVFGFARGAVVANAYADLISRVAGLGGILVAEAIRVADPELRATQLGSKTAKLVAWVRHALSHEHDHHHQHHHEHAEHPGHR